ncbi:DUF6449 domain-containing protein [Bacillus dakarensis]|uniref:DUF6449 domain-containing protein n=1 Tax=Robertmurraya dakarensis TaxID=1926278 RepID=UPI000981485C|nr:DUF6449 domain-containing protein [Bacillus dakarensis]
MQSKISLINRELFKQINRTVGWVSIIYFLGLVFALPLHLLMTETNKYRQLWEVETLFGYNYELQIIALIAIPVLLAVFLFRFLQVKQSSDLFHSLPIKRERIFHQFTLWGLFFLIIPIFLTMIILLIQYQVWDLELYFELRDIFYWAGVTVILNIIVYMAAVFIGMITGLSIVHGVLSYIFLLLPVGLIVLCTYNLQFFLYGFPDDYYLNDGIMYYSPLVILEQLNRGTISAHIILIYGIISIVLYLLALYLYKKRKVEAASQALVFPILKPVFRLGTTICGALFAAFYFGEVQADSTIWIIFGYVFGSFVGYMTAEMVIQKTWRVFSNLLKYFYYAAGLVVLVVIVQFDLLGFEDRVPEMEDVKRVHLSDNPYLYMGDFEEQPFYLEEEENIELIHGLHQQIIQEKPEQTLNSETAFFVYELENGRKLVREYSINKDNFRQYYQPIHESAEYKEASNRIFKIDMEDVGIMNIHPSGPVNRNAVIANKEEIAEAISILKEEIYTSTYDEMYNEKGFQSYINISIKNKDYTVDLPYRPSYQKFEKWLEERGLAEKAKVSVNDIAHALVVRASDLEINNRDRMAISNEALYEKMKQSPKVIKISDKDELKAMMEQSTEYYIYDETKPDYLVGFFFEEAKYPVISGLADDVAPGVLKEYFQ